MTPSYFQPQATNAHLACALRAVFAKGPVLWTILGLLGLTEAVLLAEGKTTAALSLAFAVLFSGHVVRSFCRDVLQDDERPVGDPGNAAELLSFDILQHLCKAKTATSADLLNAALRTKTGAFTADALGLDRETIVKTFSADTDAPDLLSAITASMEKAKAPRAGAVHVLAALFEHSKALQDLLNDSDLSPEDFADTLEWASLDTAFATRDEVFSPQWIRSSFGSLGRSWATGYTDDLDRLTIDVGENIVYRLNRPVVIHQQEVQSILHVLQRGSQSNVMILGKAGAGKRALVENAVFELQRRELKASRTFTRILQLRTELLLSGMRDSDTFLLHALSRAERSGRFVLVLKDLAQLLKSSDAKTKGVLMRFLQARNINIIGIATTDEYHAIIKDDPQMDQLFEKIFLSDATDDETKHVLMTRYLDLRRHGSVKLTYKALKSVLALTKRFVSKGAAPGKAVSVFDDAYLLAQSRGEPYLKEDHIREIVSLKANLNVQKLSTDERARLITLEQRLRERIIGQEDAILALVNTLKRARLEINSSKKPLGTFLFLGPTGVGKTQTAKVLAEEYFGSADRIIRVDLNEYSSPDSVTAIAGGMDAAGGFREGFLTKRVQDNPMSLILLDEIEKAHPHVLNLFLQILDEGSLIDGQGVKTDFRNTIIIATSNAGALALRDILRNNAQITKDALKTQLLDSILRDKLFSPEFVNRFDDVVVYQPLTQDQAGHLAFMMLDEVIREVRAKRGIEIELTEEVLHAIAERGYSMEFGAREMRRVVQETIETYLADYLLNHDVKRGAKISITLQDLPPKR